MIALLEAHRARLFQRQNWIPNVVSGFIVGIVALPLAMAFAIASGARPEQGIYTAIVAGLAVSLFGGSRVQIAGPTGAFIAVLSGITASHGIAGLQVATLMAGLMLVLLGAARLGGVIRFIPEPVIVGFTAGIGILIWTGQWAYFFGIDVPTAPHFHDKLWQLLQTLPDLHSPTTLLSLLSLALLLCVPRLPGLSRLPGPLVALVVGGVLQALFVFEGVATIGSAFGGIPRGLPAFALPDITLAQVITLIGPAFAIAMLGAIESLLSAVVADGMTNTRHDANQELVGQGIANLLAPLFGGFAATGAIARTATSVKNGGNSPLAGIMHVATLVAVLLVAAPLAVHVPLATLAAILFVVAWNMSGVPHFMHILRRAPRADVIILLTTFVLTVFVDLVIAVNMGVLLATVHFLRRMAASVEVRQLQTTDLQHTLGQLGMASLPAEIVVLRAEGPFFFGATHYLERTLVATGARPRVLIVELRRVPFVDITGINTLALALDHLRRRGVTVMLSGANLRVTKKLDKAGLLDLIGRGNVHATTPAALKAAITTIASHAEMQP